MEELLLDILAFSYERPAGTNRVPLMEIVGNFREQDRDLVEHCLLTLDRTNLISFSLDRSEILLNPKGKLALAQRCVMALCLGREHIVQNVRSAIVAIEVVSETRDKSMATGFFSEAFPDWLVTAAHVVRNGHTIERIFDSDMREIQTEVPLIKMATEDEPDVALVKCTMPGHCKPLQVEWDLDNITEASSVLIAGFPYVAFHDRRATFSDAFLSCMTPRRSSGLQSLVISRVTSPGYSGGPVLDSRGIVVGIVEQENESQEMGGVGVFISAVPTPYLDRVSTD